MRTYGLSTLALLYFSCSLGGSLASPIHDDLTNDLSWMVRSDDAARISRRGPQTNAPQPPSGPGQQAVNVLLPPPNPTLRNSLGIKSFSSGQSWQADVDIQNANWMFRMGQVFHAHFGGEQNLPRRVQDMWSARIPRGRKIWYLIRVEASVPRRVIPDILSWAIAPNYRDEDLQPNPWADLDNSAHPRPLATPWLRTKRYEIQAWLNQGRSRPDITILILVLPRRQSILDGLGEIPGGSRLFGNPDGDDPEQVQFPEVPPQVDAYNRGYNYQGRLQLGNVVSAGTSRLLRIWRRISGSFH